MSGPTKVKEFLNLVVITFKEQLIKYIQSLLILIRIKPKAINKYKA
jgi:hypothetical protein